MWNNISFVNICEVFVDGVSEMFWNLSQKSEIFVFLALLVLNYKHLKTEHNYCKTDVLNILAVTALKQSIGSLGFYSDFRLQ